MRLAVKLLVPPLNVPFPGPVEVAFHGLGSFPYQSWRKRANHVVDDAQVRFLVVTWWCPAGREIVPILSLCKPRKVGHLPAAWAEGDLPEATAGIATAIATSAGT